MGRRRRSESYELSSYNMNGAGKCEEGRSWVSPWRCLSCWEWCCLVALGLLPVICGSVIGVLSSTSSYRSASFRTPPWAPPAWLFAPAWVVLYLCMGTASVLVYVYGGGVTYRTLPPLILYSAQLGLNFAWTPVFFGAGYATIVRRRVGERWRKEMG